MLLQSPEVKYPVELMAIPTCQMDPMLLHRLQLMGAIHTHLLLQVSLGSEAGDYSSELRVKIGKKGKQHRFYTVF